MYEKLRLLARRLFWWKTPEEALANETRFLAQVMSQGTWEDWQIALSFWSQDEFRNALREAEPGSIDEQSWIYWHVRLGIQPIPPRPTRVFADADCAT